MAMATAIRNDVQVVVHVEEWKPSDKEVAEVDMMWDLWDTDGNGSLDEFEFAVVLKTLGVHDRNEVRVCVSGSVWECVCVYTCSKGRSTRSLQGGAWIQAPG